MKTLEYLDQVKARHALTTDYQLAKRLQVPTQTISNWRGGISNPNTFLCFRLAELLQLPPDQVIADIELERAERTGQADQAAAWRQWVDRLGSVAASVLAAVMLSATLTPGNARADNRLGQGASEPTSYTSSRSRRRRRAHAQAFQTMAETLAGQSSRVRRC